MDLANIDAATSDGVQAQPPTASSTNDRVSLSISQRQKAPGF